MYNMNFKDEIDAAYADLGLIPINGQDIAVDRILTEYFINNKKSVILSADTGTGKSIIGAVVAKVFKNRFTDEFENSDDGIKPAMIVVHSNSLVKQYGQTFDGFSSNEFHQIIGAGNYNCELSESMSLEKDKKFTGEDCVKSKADKAEQEKYCNNCEFNIARSYINTTDTLITNYSYHFINSMLTKHLKPRKLVIFDEAHTINDVFCDHAAIELSAELLNGFIDECTKSFPFNLKDQIVVLNKIRDNLLRDELNESNYVKPLDNIREACIKIAETFTERADNADIEDFVKYKRVAKRYSSIANKINDLFTYKYDHSFEYDEKEYKMLIKPIFVGNMSKNIMSEYNLFMSATISPEFMKITMQLDKDNTAFVGLDPVYDPENKQIIFCGNKRLNYVAMKDPETISYLQEVVHEITSNAAADGYKGLMLTPSFAVGETLSKAIPKGTKVFLHTSGVKSGALVKEFKEYKGGPAILISPSIYEGLDFADDLSRYQIIVKAPFPSLGDKRMEYIAKNYPDIYKIMTIKKIVQGIGRSVRNKDDWALTVILDQTAEQLFKSPLNVWRKQFKIL